MRACSPSTRATMARVASVDASSTTTISSGCLDWAAMLASVASIQGSASWVTRTAAIRVIAFSFVPRACR